MLDINKGIQQRNIDGTPRLVDGKPVSARMTLARWPDDALQVLLEATNDYLASLSGPAGASDKTEAQKDFTAIYRPLMQYASSIGATRFSPDRFPAKTGVVAGEECSLVR
jgi:hypothetical protein